MLKFSTQRTITASGAALPRSPSGEPALVLRSMRGEEALSEIYTYLLDMVTPDSLDKFLAFAEALEITLPRDVLEDLYADIRRWRDGHRKCGRYLVRTIRGAYSGRLDAPTLGRIERDWGMNARQLMQAVELATVDTVLKAAEGTIDGAH